MTRQKKKKKKQRKKVQLKKKKEEEEKERKKKTNPNFWAMAKPQEGRTAGGTGLGWGPRRALVTGPRAGHQVVPKAGWAG